ncbi:MAG: hypothetical protein AAFP84_08975 [Actinomycetota bacterium]
MQKTNSLLALRALLAATALYSINACGSDDPPSVSATVGGSGSGGAGEVAAGEVASGDIEIRAIDYAYLDVPDRIRAGTTLSLTNASKREAHELVAIKLPDGETRAAADLARLPPDELGALMAGVRTVVLAAPEQDGIPVVGDGSLTEPGRYFLACVIPTGADPDEYLEQAATSDGPPDVAGGPPHIAEGMFGEVTVVE